MTTPAYQAEYLFEFKAINAHRIIELDPTLKHYKFDAHAELKAFLKSKGVSFYEDSPTRSPFHRYHEIRFKDGSSIVITTELETAMVISMRIYWPSFAKRGRSDKRRSYSNTSKNH